MFDRDFDYIDQGSKQILHYYFIIIASNTVILYKVCVYVCIYVCMCICTNVCMYVCMYVLRYF